ncbi:MAG: hypothetical protein JNK82_31445 [Myxococcaceae bacterium]|nr:hypothetical protein [Myxococcaceae bacterium]
MSRLRLSLMALVALAACDPGTLENPDRFRACMIDVEVDIFLPKCGSAGCHAANSAQIDLVSPGIGMRIATTNSPTCQSKPMRSYLAEKLTDSPSCGAPMPLGEALPNAELKCVRDYLLALSADGGT